MTITTWDPPEHDWPADDVLEVRAGAHGSGSVRLELCGDLCAFTSPLLRDHLIRLEREGVTTVVIDLTDLRFCTSHGIEELAAARARMRAVNGDLRIERANGVVRRVLDIVGIVHDQPR